MAFSSIPGYFDASNWHQQQNHQIIGGHAAKNHFIPPPAQPPPPPQPPLPHGGGSIRPGSMAERARMANIPMPEAALKCPRCESTNTKFCYFNNYSLSQPRHFCKTCRRYWTKGGALRNVPVGGGCRRNKRSKSRSSMSPASTDRQTNTSSTNIASTTNGGSAGIIGLSSQLPQLRFTSPLSQLTDTFTGDMGFDYSGITAPVVGVSNEMHFHGMSNVLGSTGEMASLFSNGNGNIDPWSLQQPLSFLGDQEVPPTGIFRFHGGEHSVMRSETSCDQVRPKFSALSHQNPSVKLEPQMNLSRQIISGIQRTDPWNANPTWNELSGFSSSSTNKPL